MDNVMTAYKVRVVGKLWMPMCAAAMDYRVDAAKLPKYTRCDDETDIAYETRMVECAVDMMAGDFSSVDAYEIVKHEYWFDTPVPNHERVVGESTTYTRHDRYTTLREFDEDAEMVYNESMFGYDDSGDDD